MGEKITNSENNCVYELIENLGAPAVSFDPQTNFDCRIRDPADDLKAASFLSYILRLLLFGHRSLDFNFSFERDIILPLGPTTSVFNFLQRGRLASRQVNFNFLKNMFYFPLLILKDIYH